MLDLFASQLPSRVTNVEVSSCATIMSPAVFTCFGRLPAELRVMIWEEALSLRTVCAVSCEPVVGDQTGETSKYFLDFIGPVPYMAGISCGEAWHIMQRRYVPFTGPGWNPATARPTGVPWVDLDKTVFYLGASSDVPAVLGRFDAREVPRLEHVAMTWAWRSFGRLIKTCRDVATACPALRSIVIITNLSRFEAETGADAAPEPALSIDLAAHISCISATPRVDLRVNDTVVKPDLPWLLSRYVRRDSPPRLHFFSLQ